MARIRADGTIDTTSNGVSIGKGTSSSSSSSSEQTVQGLLNQLWALPTHWKVGILAVVLFATKSYLNPNPLANGNIPAAALLPDQHWNRIANDDGFVRSMTGYLGATTFWKGRQKHLTKIHHSNNQNGDEEPGNSFNAL